LSDVPTSGVTRQAQVSTRKANFMQDKPKERPARKRAGGLPAYSWIGVGIALGAGIGVALGNIAVGAGAGVALGVALDMGQQRNQSRKRNTWRWRRP